MPEGLSETISISLGLRFTWMREKVFDLIHEQHEMNPSYLPPKPIFWWPYTIPWRDKLWDFLISSFPHVGHNIPWGPRLIWSPSCHHRKTLAPYMCTFNSQSRYQKNCSGLKTGYLVLSGRRPAKNLVIARFPAHAKVWAVKWIFLHLFRTTKTFTHVDYILFGQPATLGGLRRYQGFLVKDDLEKEKAEKRLSKV